MPSNVWSWSEIKQWKSVYLQWMHSNLYVREQSSMGEIMFIFALFRPIQIEFRSTLYLDGFLDCDWISGSLRLIWLRSSVTFVNLMTSNMPHVQISAVCRPMECGSCRRLKGFGERLSHTPKSNSFLSKTSTRWSKALFHFLTLFYANLR